MITRTIGPYRMPTEGLPARLEVILLSSENGRHTRVKKAFPFSTPAGEVEANESAVEFTKACKK